MNIEGGIKSIVFDFGGIFIDLDQEGTMRRMAELMGLEFNSKEDIPDPILHMLKEYEVGQINTETMIWNIQHHSVNEKPQGIDVIKVWNSMLIGMKSHKFEKLSELRKHYKLYLLSNINDLHLEWVNKYFKRTYDILDWDRSYFVKTYYSHLVGMRKPNMDIFEFVWNDAGLVPEETLFVDDTLENIQAAQTMGINTLHHNPSEDVFDALDKYFDIVKSK